MTTYLVRWEIDIEASSPTDAAFRALAIQRNPESIATVFSVSWDRTETRTVEIDLQEELDYGVAT